jgi:hypothetical protein
VEGSLALKRQGFLPANLRIRLWFEDVSPILSTEKQVNMEKKGNR